MPEYDENKEFISIVVSKACFKGEPWRTEKMKDAVQDIRVDDGFYFSRPLKQLHEIKDEPENVLLYFPKWDKDGKEYKITLTRNELQQEKSDVSGQPQYDKREIKVTPDRLKQMYDNSSFINIAVPEAYVIGETWQTEKMKEPRQNFYINGYQFSRDVSQIRTRVDVPGKVFLSFPRKTADGSDYTIELKKSVRNEDDTYSTEEKQITSFELMLMYNADKVMYKYRKENEFVEIVVPKSCVSEKTFSTESGERREVTTPEGYTFSRKAEQFHDIEGDDDNYLLYIPVKAQNDSDYMVTVSKSSRQEDGSFYKQSEEVTAMELKRMCEDVGIHKRKVR